jgi:hypothetical protein
MRPVPHASLPLRKWLCRYCGILSLIARFFDPTRVGRCLQGAYPPAQSGLERGEDGTAGMGSPCRASTVRRNRASRSSPTKSRSGRSFQRQMGCPIRYVPCRGTHARCFQAIGQRNAEGVFAPIRIRAPFTSTKIAPCSGSPAGVDVLGAFSTTTWAKPGSFARARFPSPFIDKARANIGAPRNLGHHRPRLLDRRQNPRPLFVTPATTALVACHQCHPTHAAQLASLLKPT